MKDANGLTIVAINTASGQHIQRVARASNPSENLLYPCVIALTGVAPSQLSQAAFAVDPSAPLNFTGADILSGYFNTSTNAAMNTALKGPWRFEAAFTIRNGIDDAYKWVFTTDANGNITMDTSATTNQFQNMTVEVTKPSGGTRLQCRLTSGGGAAFSADIRKSQLRILARS